MKPLLAYYGGKQKIADRLLQSLPRHTCYCEPFAGGAALLFHKPQIYASEYVEAINDKNRLIYTCYKVAREQPDALYRHISFTPYGSAEFYQAKRICKDPEQYNELTVAWAVYCNCNFSFAKKMSAGFGYSKESNVAHTRANQRQRLSGVLDRLSAVTIMNLDAIEFIQKFDDKKTCFYCDPPYVDTDQGHYGGYTQEDFDRLIACLDRIEGSFVLSTYANESLNETGWDSYTISTTMTAKMDKNANKSEQESQDKQRTEYVYVKPSTYGKGGANLELRFA